jgi:hypothetical protein
MEPCERMQRGAEYLRYVLDDFEREPKGFKFFAQPEQPITELLSHVKDDDAASSIASTDDAVSSFSRALSVDTSTTFSADVPETEGEATLSYNYWQFRSLLGQVIERLTLDQLLLISEHPASANMISRGGDDASLRSLKPCPITGIVHEFDRHKRCVGCDDQLCRVSQAA